MTASKELAVKSLQGATMAEEDVLALNKSLCAENPLGALSVLSTLEKMRVVTQELAQIENLIDDKVTK